MGKKLRNVRVAVKCITKINAASALTYLGYVGVDIVVAAIKAAKVVISITKFLFFSLVIIPLSTITAVVSPTKTVLKVLEIFKPEMLGVIEVPEDLKISEPETQGSWDMSQESWELRAIRSWIEEKKRKSNIFGLEAIRTSTRPSVGQKPEDKES